MPFVLRPAAAIVARPYVAFVIDVFSRRIVGWKADTTMRTDLVLDTLDMAIWARDILSTGLSTRQTRCHLLVQQTLRGYRRVGACVRWPLHASEPLSMLPHVLEAIQVDVQSDVWSIVTALAAAVAAIGTLGAVVTALFLPRWQAKQSRPKLTLSPEVPGLWTTSYRTAEADKPSEPHDGPVLLISNERGKDTAHGVEVLLTVYERPDQKDPAVEPLTIRRFADRALNYSDNDGYSGTRSANVGPGATRRVYLTRIGDPTVLFKSWCPEERAVPPGIMNNGLQFLKFCGAWATYPARQDELVWLVSGALYWVEMLIVGDNFDALTYRGRIQAYIIDNDSDPKRQSRSVAVKWLVPLAPATKKLGEK